MPLPQVNLTELGWVTFAESFNKCIHKTDKDRDTFFENSFMKYGVPMTMRPYTGGKVDVIIYYIKDLVINYNASLSIEGKYSHGGELDAESIKSYLKEQSEDFKLNEMVSTKSMVTFMEQGQMRVNICIVPKIFSGKYDLKN